MAETDGTITYDYVHIDDYTSNLMSFSRELENIRAEAQQELDNLHHFYTTQQGSVRYYEAQTHINEGIEEGMRIIRQHGDAVDTAAQGMQGADAAAANSL